MTPPDPSTTDASPPGFPASVSLERAGCPLGCRSADDVVLEGQDRLHGLPGRFRVVRCRECRLMRTDPRPTPETIGFYYPAAYGPFRAPRAETSLGGAERPLWKRLLDPVFGVTYATVVPEMAPGKMLEIGCAAGAFLQSMASRGWRVAGIEASAGAAAVAAGLGFSVRAGQVETVDAPEGPFGLIVGWNVLEHLHHPVDALRRLAGWAEPEGRLVVSMPNASGLGFRLFGACWYDLDLPRHLLHLTPGTAKRLLEASGWRVDRVFQQRNAVGLLGSLGHATASRLAAQGRVTRFLQGLPERGGRLASLTVPVGAVLGLLGLSDRMTVWATKAE